MGRKLPTPEEFEVLRDEVVHKPTDARWTAYPGVALPHLQNPGMLGSVLPGGDEYSEDDVLRVALKLLRERPGVRQEAG